MIFRNHTNYREIILDTNFTFDLNNTRDKIIKASNNKI